MFSVIIPTLWKCNINSFLSLIKQLQNNNYINEIIIINNNLNYDSSKLKTFSKIHEIKQNNIFVNPSWNLGYIKSISDFLCFLNDDIFFDVNIFSSIYKILSNKDINIIGFSKECYTNKFYTNIIKYKQTLIRNRNYGSFFCIKKNNYKLIPEELKIWFGDDYLFQNNINNAYVISNFSIESNFNGVGGNTSTLPEFKEIINNDILYSKKYYLPFSNDY